MLIGLSMIGCGPSDPDANVPPHDHDYSVVVDHFDALDHFAKKVKCSQCSKTKTYSNITITNEAELFALAADINAGKNIGSLKISIVNDITLTQNWTPININSARYTYEFNSGSQTNKVNIIGLTTDADTTGFAGFFGIVTKTLTVSNICIKGGNISGTNAGAFIGKIGIPSATANQVITFNGCDVDGAVINGSLTAGGYYGISDADSTGNSLNINKCNIKANVNSGEYAGAICGQLGSMTDYRTLQVTIGSDVTFTSCNVNSRMANGAGEVVGFVGLGYMSISGEASASAHKNITATVNQMVIKRVYGKTGWTDANHIGYLNYDSAYTLTYADAQDEGAN
jgi:hypothetical protein